jgi:hypothetical protein
MSKEGKGVSQKREAEIKTGKVRNFPKLKVSPKGVRSKTEKR